MCLGAWSLRGFVKDLDIKAATVLPELAHNANQNELLLDWDAILL